MTASSAETAAGKSCCAVLHVEDGQLTEHMLSLGAENVLSIGSDYDGCRIKPELRGIEKIPSICVYLEEHGIPEEICKKIFFENAAHFFEKVLQPRRVML